VTTIDDIMCLVTASEDARIACESSRSSVSESVEYAVARENVRKAIEQFVEESLNALDGVYWPD